VTKRLAEVERTQKVRWEFEDGPVVPGFSANEKVRVTRATVEFSYTNDEEEYVDVSVRGQKLKADGTPDQRSTSSGTFAWNRALEVQLVEEARKVLAAGELPEKVSEKTS